MRFRNTAHWPCGLFAVLALTGCHALPPRIPVIDGTIYENTKAPQSYRGVPIRQIRPESLSRRETHGEACRTLIALPFQVASPFPVTDYAAQAMTPLNTDVAWGDWGFAAAIADARANAGGADIYDVRFDVHLTSYLSIFQRQCLEVHASVIQ
jgi:hypothetical protein